MPAPSSTIIADQPAATVSRCAGEGCGVATPTLFAYDARLLCGQCADAHKSVQHKTCGHCRALLPVSDFYKCRSKRDGLTSYCRSCHRASSDRWAAAHLEHRKEYKRKYVAAHKEELWAKAREKNMGKPPRPGARARLNRWVTENPERAMMARRGREAVRRAVRSGELLRGTSCEECGTSEKRIEAAHYDYTQPLFVRWLCRSCHLRWDSAAPKTLLGQTS